VNPILPDKSAFGYGLDKQKAEVLEVRQVFDLPEPKLEVAEHRKLGCTCEKCGAYNEREFPEEVKARVQYVIGVQTLVVMLNVAFKMPIKKIQTLFTDLYGYGLNESTIVSSTIKCFEQLASSERVIKHKAFCKGLLLILTKQGCE
jgi:transposase